MILLEGLTGKIQIFFKSMNLCLSTRSLNLQSKTPVANSNRLSTRMFWAWILQTQQFVIFTNWPTLTVFFVLTQTTHGKFNSIEYSSNERIVSFGFKSRCLIGAFSNIKWPTLPETDFFRPQLSHSRGHFLQTLHQSSNGYPRRLKGVFRSIYRILETIWDQRVPLTFFYITRIFPLTKRSLFHFFVFSWAIGLKSVKGFRHWFFWKLFFPNFSVFDF